MNKQKRKRTEEGAERPVEKNKRLNEIESRKEQKEEIRTVKKEQK